MFGCIEWRLVVTRATGRSTLGITCRSHIQETTQANLPAVSFDRVEHEIWVTVNSEFALGRAASRSVAELPN